ncbi:hypothetical protein [Amantichitinum ursilacus]|uniref:Uncharacterized protein n=1 Tax=Amantichitinum ursilacus TaxID=857265 RepID=A0A0N0XK70_9NEIS|nr:hypothetical protein [Amantichitinum ursilacus]KPC53000.1 hypothetical protein WG78_10935 [Amantichitinum ursilacus]
MALNLIGLTGPAGSGKDTVADFLVAKHGYTKLAFADKLRAEICDAFDVSEQMLLERETKSTPMHRLAFTYCRDRSFVLWYHGIDEGTFERLDYSLSAMETRERSPRWIMQTWGDYRRATNPHYFIDAMQDRLDVLPGRTVVISDVRVNPGERASQVNAEALFVHAKGGEVWQLTRPGHGHSGHTTEHAFDRRHIDRNLMNYGTLQSLQRQVELFVAAEAA